MWFGTSVFCGCCLFPRAIQSRRLHAGFLRLISFYNPVLSIYHQSHSWDGNLHVPQKHTLEKSSGSQVYTFLELIILWRIVSSRDPVLSSPIGFPFFLFLRTSSFEDH